MRAVDDRRDVAIRWGYESNEYFIYFNVAAWRVIGFMARAVGKSTEDAILDVLIGPLTAGATPESPIYRSDIPKLKFEWLVRGTEAILCFRGQTFESFCRCVDLPREPTQQLILKAIADNLVLMAGDFEPQGRGVTENRPKPVFSIPRRSPRPFPIERLNRAWVAFMQPCHVANAGSASVKNKMRNVE